jgi:hypothetical protein
VVSNLKAHLDPEGPFAKVKLTSLDSQKQAVLNYFIAIKSFYDKQGLWAKNPFLRGAGFNGALDYLANSLLIKCAEKRSFSVSTFSSFLGLDGAELLTIDTIKNLDGKTARTKVRNYLGSHILRDLPDNDEYEF